MTAKKLNDIESCLRIINNKKIKKIFILTGFNSLRSSGLDKKIIENIDKKKEIKIYFKKKVLPETGELLKIFNSFKTFSPNILLAIGGGAVLDYAKIINILKNDKNLISKIKNYNYVSNKKNSRLIAIPTTAGSGAEVTSNAVIYHKNIKYSFEDVMLVPNNYCLCPSALINIPENIKASSGFDAIAQAIESILSTKSNNISQNYAVNSLKISNKVFLDYLKKPNIFNSSKMAIAANLSGYAINISKTTAPHACSYGFSAIHNLSHGHAVSLNFDRFMYFNYQNMNYEKNKKNLHNKFTKIFKATNTKNITEFLRYIKYLKRFSGLEDNYKKLNININKDVNKILSGVNPLRLKNNPVEINRDSLKKIILQEKF